MIERNRSNRETGVVEARIRFGRARSRGANSERVRNRVCTGAAQNPNFKSSANFLLCGRCRRCSGGPFIAAVLNRSWAGIYKAKFVFGSVFSECIPNLIRGFHATVYVGKTHIHCLKIVENACASLLKAQKNKIEKYIQYLENPASENFPLVVGRRG